MPTRSLDTTLWRWLPLAMLGTLAVLVVPGAGDHPFSGPKLVAWSVFGAALALLALRRSEKLALTVPVAFAALNALAWALAALTGDAARPDAVLLQGLAAATWLVFAFHPPRTTQLVDAATAAGALVSLVAVAQSGAPRMGIHSTLGNPDFVAGFVAPCLVLASTKRRWAACALMLGALCLTKSWGTVLALAAAAAVLRTPALLGASLVTALAAATRELSPIVQGRFAHWADAIPQLSVLGHGPGAALALTGVDHVHQDYVERLLEGGVLGLAALVLPIAWALRRRTAASAALAAFAARMAVDFPLARPAELCLFVFLVTTEEEAP